MQAEAIRPSLAVAVTNQPLNNCVMKLKIIFPFFFSGFLLSQESAHAQCFAAYQLDQLTSELLTDNSINIIGTLLVDAYRAGGVAASAGRPCNSYIFTDPNAMCSETWNTWAFILGHELSHIYLGHTTWGSCGPACEFEADRIGAQMAINAGYDIYAYLWQMEAQPNYCTESHGCWEDRVANLKNSFGIPHYSHHEANCSVPVAHGPFPTTYR